MVNHMKENIILTLILNYFLCQICRQQKISYWRETIKIVGCMKSRLGRGVARVIGAHSNIVLATNLGQKDFQATKSI